MCSSDLLIKLKDPETEKRMWVNTSSKKVRMLYKNHWDESSLVSQRIMVGAGIESVDIEVRQDYIKLLLGLFRKKTALKF